MKKIVFIILLVSNCAFAQTSLLNSNLVSFPNSPEAGKMGTFGALPVNLFFGQIEKNVELFEGIIDDISIPVKLNYNYSGNKLEELPSISGLGWNLNLGGVITREVRGIPDEHNRGFYGVNSSYFKQTILNPYFNSGTISYLYADKIIKGEYDAEPDKYNVSVNGISFSFKIGLDGNAVYLSPTNHKLQINKNFNNPAVIDSFILTDTNANKYIFDLKETNDPIGRDDIIFNDSFQNYISSWQISKIITNNNNEVLYSYLDDEFVSYNFYAVGIFKGIFGTEPDTAPSYDQGYSSDLIKRKLLTSISTPSFNINLNIATVNMQKIYTKITINDFNNKIVDSFDFDYIQNRNLLKNINRNGLLFSNFEYEDEGNFSKPFIDSFVSFPWGQDDWGYANSAGNAYGITMPGTPFQSDKSSNFTETKKGALKKITYPTKGFTEIFYEQNTIKGRNLGNSQIKLNRKIHLKFKSDNVAGSPFTKEMFFTKTFDTNVVATLAHEMISNQYGHIEVSVLNTSNTCSTIGYSSGGNYYNSVPYSRNVNNTSIPEVCPSLSDELSDGQASSYAVINKSSGGQFIIPAGTYEFRIKSLHNNYRDVKAEIILEFFDPGNGSIYTNEKTGGIRVSKTIDHPNTGKSIVTNYNYNDDDGFSTAESFTSKIDILNYTERFCRSRNAGFAGGWTGSYNMDYDITEYNSRSYNDILKQGSPVYYKKVKEYEELNEMIVRPLKFLCQNCGGNFVNYDNSPLFYALDEYGIKKNSFPKGYKITEFENPFIGAGVTSPFVPNGRDQSLGNKKIIITYAKQNIDEAPQKLSQINFKYLHTIAPLQQLLNSQNGIYNSNYPKSLKIGYKIKKAGTCNIVPQNESSATYFKYVTYNESDNQTYLSSKSQSNFYNDQQVVVLDTIIYNPITYQKTKEETKLNNTNKTSSEYYYPNDFNDITSVKMVEENYLTTLLKQINKKNDIILETSKFEFEEIKLHFFKPKSFYLSKNNNDFEKKKEFNYNFKGKLAAITTTYPNGLSPGRAQIYSGPVMQIIWGYNNSLIIAKIESGAYFTIPPQIINDLEYKANVPYSAASELILSDALNGLRNSFPNAMITTYTHKPLIGVSTITDPKGDIIKYFYDSMNRLEYVLDKNNNKLSENKYNYKQ